ncbi:S1 family peptidase [Streptomyces sporangiiformans]|uniref:S1 family peptidase n=1 Tax=Streptomyces sporangiiformans TaxID=2315329 RepID=A0A505DR90_9ACTN|nr:S1 family peptidase [Streptomyces sporangiiformans]TPQ23622.1 S1 family peptidase [Streptomyces sporangiiformans]
MRHARRNVQRFARFAAIGGLVCGGLMVSHAMASETPDDPTAPGAVTRAAETGRGLVSELGTTRTAGTWIAEDGSPVVAVTDEEAAADVRRAGARAKMVDHNMRDLRSAKDTLSDAPRVSGTSWSMDYKSNQVVVRADTTVSADEWARMTKLAESIGKSVRMERTEGTFTPRLNGAAAMFAGAGRCSAGFNVTDGKTNFILTAGHCGPTGTTWFSDQQGRERVGTTVAGEFPGSDFSLVEYPSGTALTGADVVSVGNGQGVRITGADDPAVGQKVFRSGSTTGLQSGEVTGLDTTVNYPQGTVSGLIETTVCAEPGDSGGPMFADGRALGVTSGGSGDCDSGGTTFFQPITKALDTLGVQLATDPQSDAKDTPSAGDDGNGAAAPPAGSGGTGPGETVPGGGQTDTASSPFDQVAEYRSLGPGLFVIAGSLVALVAIRIRSERGRRAYRQQYSQSWG